MRSLPHRAIPARGAILPHSAAEDGALHTLSRSPYAGVLIYFGDAPARLRVISMSSETFSSNSWALMLKSLRLMVKVDRFFSQLEPA